MRRSAVQSGEPEGRPLRSVTIDAVPDELAEARAKIDAAREALQALNSPLFREALARLDRMSAELERLEEKLGGRAVTAS